MKGKSDLLVLSRQTCCSCSDLVGRDMGLTVLRADAPAGSATNASAGMVDDHDHAIELTIEVVVTAIAGAEDFIRIIDTVCACWFFSQKSNTPVRETITRLGAFACGPPSPTVAASQSAKAMPATPSPH